MKQLLRQTRFGPSTHFTINKINEVLHDFKGMPVTVRQLFYQFIGRGIFPQDNKYYNRLSRAATNGRTAGLIDCDLIEDRVRYVHTEHRWDKEAPPPKCKSPWESLPYEPEIWIEKDALSGIAETVCGPECVSYLPCRGYISKSAMYAFQKRYFQSGRKIKILYLGDYDPSGMEIFKDIERGLKLFKINMKPERIAITKEQINKYKPTPNPAKGSDSNSENFKKEFGIHSYEVDALDPKILQQIIRNNILKYKRRKA